MATVLAATAAKVQAIEDAGIASASLGSDGHLRLTRNDASQIDAGSVQSPSGSVTMFAGASVPSGWLLCNGQAVSRTTYAGLFSAIGTTYGSGDGSTTFNVPNLEGRLPRMEAANRGVTGGAITHSHTAAHDHALAGGSTDAHAQIVFASSGPPSGRINRLSTTPTWTETHEFTATGATVSAGSTGGIGTSAKVAGQSASTTPTTSSTSQLPPYLNLNFIIKV
jgi:microcystin-dependent protein